ncbi:MAG: hypothetical protein ABEN55_18395 [Bradymonadaceae bacterium]
MTTSDDNDNWSIREILSRPRRLDLIWLMLPTVIALAGFGLVPLRSWDYWWHITMGRLINYCGAVPAANHFLYTMAADAPSYDQPWLSQLILYGLHFNGSVYLPLIVRNVAAAAAVGWLSLVAMRRCQSVVIGSLSVLPLLLALVEVRPTLFAWPLFCLLLGLGYAIYERRRSHWWLLAFPPVAALWANLHGSFLLATVVCGILGVAACARERNGHGRFNWAVPARWGGTTAATLSAAMANPRTWEIYGYVYGQFTNDVVATTVTEWLPTTLTNPPGIGAYFYGLLLLAGGFAIWKRQHIDLADRLLFGVFALFAIGYARGLLWFAFVVPFAVGPSLSKLAGPASEREKATPHGFLQGLHTFVALGLVTTAFAVQPTWQWRVDWTADSGYFDVREREPMRGVVPDETPFEATQVLGRYTQPPRMFHDERYAGFLLYHLTDSNPRQLVFVDQRIELPPNHIWQLYYDVIAESDLWRGVFHQYEIRAAVLSTAEQPALIERLDGTDDWKTVRKTDDWVFFLQRDDG